MKLPLLILAFSLLCTAMPARAAEGYGLEIQDESGRVVQSFNPFPEGTAGSVTAADLGTDGTAEIIVGAGLGTKPLVRVLRQDGSMIGEFFAYAENFTGGVNVTTCDLDGDGLSEIITGAGYGGGPHVRAFSHLGVPTGLSFFAYAPDFRGGVNVTCGDLNQDGKAEIITGAGITGGPHIKVFSAPGELLDEAFSDSASKPTGALVALADTDGDDTPEVLVSPAGYSDPNVTIFTWSEDALHYKQALVTGATPTYGSPVAGFDSNQDGTDEIVVGGGAFGAISFPVLTTVGTQIQTYTPTLSTLHATLIPVPLHDTHADHLLFLAAASPLGQIGNGKYIKVDLSEQRLTAYDQGIPVKSFLVSTGTSGWPTPVGVTSVTAKIPLMDYSWYFGPDNPNNYSLPNVKWNLRFKTHYYIHSAYWHNNFGHPMSHGCVNTSIPDAEWIYEWANVGTVVEVQQ